jgi:ribonuclease T1
VKVWPQARTRTFALIGLLACLFTAPAPAQPRYGGGAPAVAIAELPQEARATLGLIRRDGPFPYDRDGVVFGNFERQLPVRARGYYREYTVPTPGVTHRGARRIIAGRDGELYYTQDHYRSFRRIVE